jgi:hypothetical protein
LRFSRTHAPGCEFIGAAEKLVAHFLNAEDILAAVDLFDPIPERWTEVKAVIKVLRLC